MGKIMVIGLGGLGGVLLELLARESLPVDLVAAGRDVEHVRAACNLARVGALAQGHAVSLSDRWLDFDVPSSITAAIEAERPAGIVMTASRQTWWLPDRFPAAAAARLRRAGFGVWLPVHVALTLRLMRALHAAGFEGWSLTASYPDVANCVLGRLGLAPSCGLGNLDELVPKVQILAAQRLGVPPDAVGVELVAHHALEVVAFGAHPQPDRVPPFFVRVTHDDIDVTDQIDARRLLLAPFPIPSGPATHFLTAGSAVRLIRALLADEPSRLHAPGPAGLPGGYPIEVSRRGIEIKLPRGLTRAEAIGLNEASHAYDGIERIEPDGTVVFTSAAADALAAEIGYECRRLPPADIDGRADELMARFGQHAARHGVRLKEAARRADPSRRT